METIITASKLSKSYSLGVKALNEVDLSVFSGEVVVLMGPSGSGKSTLIRTFNGLENIDTGELEVLGVRLGSFATEKNILRVRKKVGMVFQQFNLFPHLSILENVTLAQIKVQKVNKEKAEAKAMNLLKKMGIVEQANKYPNQLSGGQQQRVAIVRALALEPTLMLFDEPTSALDPERIKEVLDAMRDLAKQGMTMVVVTHEIGFAREVADRVVFMDKGKIIEESDPKSFFTAAKEERSRKFLNQMMQ